MESKEILRGNTMDKKHKKIKVSPGKPYYSSKSLKDAFEETLPAQNFREPTMLKDVPSFSSHRTTYMPERLGRALTVSGAVFVILCDR